MYILIYIILSAVISFSIYFYYFPFAVVVGPSMEPTYWDGDILRMERIIKPENYIFHSGGIYAFIPPVIDRHKKYAIKRLWIDSSSGKLYMFGDNKGNSFDSRNYGPVDVNRIKFKIIGKLK